MKEVKISAVVVTYNRLSKLKEAIYQLKHQTFELYQIIIVNNNSSDGTKEYLNSVSSIDSQIQVLNLESNIGGAGGFFKGSKLAMKNGADWVALSDDDAMYDEKYFSLINNVIETKKEYLAFSGNVRSEDGAIQVGHRRIVTDWSTLESRPLSDIEYTEDTEIDIFSFVGAVISKIAFIKVGYPNSEYFISEDDTEFSLRIRTIGKILNINKAFITHKSSVSSDSDKLKQRERWIMFYGLRNHALNVMKYSKNKWRAKEFLIVDMMKRYIKLVLGTYFKGRRWYFFKMYLEVCRSVISGEAGINTKYLP